MPNPAGRATFLPRRADNPRRARLVGAVLGGAAAERGPA